MNGGFGTIIQIGDILVSEDLVTEYFSCDYETCKGVCCIEGDSGAPVEESELEALERDYPEYSREMSEAGKEAVGLNGFFELDRDGDIVTTLIPGSGLCAYAQLTDDGACLCCIEKCGRRKPVSCSLYPVRVTKLTGGGTALNVHHWDICRPAFEKGRKENTKVYQFLKEPLTEAYGEAFYEALCEADRHINQSRG